MVFEAELHLEVASRWCLVFFSSSQCTILLFGVLFGSQFSSSVASLGEIERVGDDDSEAVDAGDAATSSSQANEAVQEEDGEVASS